MFSQVLKIADFGLARGCDAKNSKYTGTVCTRWYRPPEILLGERNYTTAIDIWGVCVQGLDDRMNFFPLFLFPPK